MTRMSKLMTHLGLEVNTTKTRIARLPRGTVRLPRLHGWSLPRRRRAPYFGTRPSRKAVKSLVGIEECATTADAQAICEAVGRPSMRFVPVKSAAQQAALLHHRVRDLLVRQRTMLINAVEAVTL
jgi:transposase